MASSVLCPLLVSTFEKRHGHTGEAPKEGQEGNQMAGESVHGGKTEGMIIF